ncbi:MAG TPA: hypothetical protein VKB00_10205 [Candidatus Limnocylindrales bacterium]|nr:hypothetical protein [Candidatus Limnocylindrales bacterium]
MRGEPLRAVALIEIVALMLERIIEPSCRYTAHFPWVWFGEGGQPICGVCHPPARGHS